METLKTIVKEANLTSELNSDNIIESVFNIANGIIKGTPLDPKVISNESISNFKVTLVTIDKLKSNKDFIKNLTKDPYDTLKGELYIYQPGIWDTEIARRDADITSTTCLPNSNRPCPKCKQLMLHEQAQQLRSNDEGVTMIYDCCNCGHHFQENT